MPEPDDLDDPPGATRRDWLAGSGALLFSSATGLGGPAVAAPIPAPPEASPTNDRPDGDTQTGPIFRRVYLQK